MQAIDSQTAYMRRDARAEFATPDEMRHEEAFQNLIGIFRKKYSGYFRNKIRDVFPNKNQERTINYFVAQCRL
jgi:hypothetical protein